MHPLLLKYGLPLAGIAAVGLAIWAYGGAQYAKGKVKGKAEIQALWDADRKVWQEDFDEQVKETQAKETEAAAILKENEDAWKKERESLVAGGRSTARRLFAANQALAGSCPVPADAGPGGGTGSASEESSVAEEIRRLVEEIRGTAEEHFGNCADDSSVLGQVQTKWEEVRAVINR